MELHHERCHYCPERKDRNAILLSVFGGVSGKGSLAKERNSYTFLSNLVRTTLACFLLRVPHEVCTAHQREKTDRVDEKHAKSPGRECFVAKLLCWRCEVPARPRQETSPLC